MKTKITTTQVIVYLLISLGFAMYSKAATYLECSSKDLNSCKKEVTKGEAIKGILTNNGKKYVKIEFQTVNEKKGTLVKDSE